MDFRNQTFTAGQSVILDGNRFFGCTFEDDCVMEWHGTEGPHFDHCRFGVPRFAFGDHALPTISLLNFFWNMPGGANISVAAIGRNIVVDKG